MKCQIARTLIAAVACLLLALTAVAVAADTAPLAATASYDELMAQQDAFIQTISFRTMMLSTSASYDELMAQQDTLFQTMADRSAALAATAAYDELMAQQDAFIQRIAAGDQLN